MLTAVFGLQSVFETKEIVGWLDHPGVSLASVGLCLIPSASIREYDESPRAGCAWQHDR